ncbi:MAG: hypothetical protein SNJ53_08405 [Thermodesulfovibrionales bacterium]
MKSDSSIGGAYRSIPAKQTKNPFVFIKKSTKKKKPTADYSSQTSQEKGNNASVDITV